MSIDELRHFFGWVAALNYAILIIWFLICVAARPFLMSLCIKLFRVTEETYDKGMYYGLTFYKLATILFALMPYVALRIMK